MTTWRKLANPQFGSWPVNANILADWDSGRRERESSGGAVKLALTMRLELVAAGSRGDVDLDGFGPWNARQLDKEWKLRWPVWHAAGFSLLFNLAWTQDPRLQQADKWLGYWNIERTRKQVQLQSFVMDVANSDYQDWIVPRVMRAFEESGADALYIGIKDDRFGMPTQKLSVPTGGMDVRDGSVNTRIGNVPDLITSTATPGFADGIRAILRRCGLPFLTTLQLRTPSPGYSFTAAEMAAAQRDWVGDDLEALWHGHL